MTVMDKLMHGIGERFGVLAESNTHQLTVIARNTDVAVGDLFLLPCRRGPDRFYIFRTTQYANILNRTIEINDVARNKLTMPDSYLSEDLIDEKLIELKGMLLGYAEWQEATDTWDFLRPRRLPQHLSDVYHVTHDNPEVADIIRELMQTQLGQDGLFLGHLLAGENALSDVPVYLPPLALSHHIGVFGRTGSGKSNLMMVLLYTIMRYNAQHKVHTPPISIFAIDPHDEFRTWHSATGGTDGIRGIVEGYSASERKALVEPFYYLTAKNIGDAGLERQVMLSRADIVPDDLMSVMEFSEQQIAFAQQFYSDWGENWIGRLMLGDTADRTQTAGEFAAQYLEGTISAVQRRVSFLRYGHTRLVTRFDTEMGYDYESTLPDIICALEQGRVMIVDTTLMTELEQFLLTTIVARVLFSIRKALRTAEDAATLADELRLALGNDDMNGQIGMRTLADVLVERLESGALPYLDGDTVRSPDTLPFINVVVEEAPSILNPQRLRFGSIFRDISRQGRKFGIGLTVVSQQVSAIDNGILTQINTEITMPLGNETERREAIRNASADLYGFERELQVMSRGQALLSASYKDIPLPIHIPNYDDLWGINGR